MRGQASKMARFKPNGLVDAKPALKDRIRDSDGNNTLIFPTCLVNAVIGKVRGTEPIHRID
jgi:hypothetical protein